MKTAINYKFIALSSYDLSTPRLEAITTFSLHFSDEQSLLIEVEDQHFQSSKNVGD